MRTARPRLRSAKLPSQENLLAFLEVPLSLCINVLKQANWPSNKIVALLGACAKPRYWRRILASILKEAPLKERQIDLVGQIFFYTHRYRKAVLSSNWPKILSNRDEITKSEGELCRVIGIVSQSSLGSSVAVESKKRVSAEILQLARLKSDEYVRANGVPPKKEYLWSLVMEERSALNLPLRKRSWFYDLLKKNPIR